MPRVGTIGIVVLVLLAAGRAPAQVAEPLRTRNLSPPIAIFMLPSWQPQPERRRAGASLEVANHYRLSQEGQDYLLLDGETLRLNLHAEKLLRSGWSIGVELPLVRQSGGFLDDAIDGWHSIFDLPDGGRNGRPEDVLEYRLGRGGDEMITLRQDSTAIGDLVLSAARRIGAGEALTVRFSAKLPTGDVDILAGSGATDWMATLLYRRAFAGPRLSPGIFWGAGLIASGSPDRIRLSGEDLVVTGLVGGTLSFGSRLGFKAQVEVHTAYYDTPLEELGQTAVQVSLGGWWHFGSNVRLDFAISEDLHVSTAPDVALHAGVQWNW